MISRILVAVDDSPRAEEVIQAAAELGRSFGATVLPLRVIEIPPEFPAAAAGNPPDHLTRHLQDQARAALEEALARFAPGAPFERPEVRSGVPWLVITEVADRIEADVIVIGSHGYHGWDRLLGTTTVKVVKRSSHSVFVVHRRRPIL